MSPLEISAFLLPLLLPFSVRRNSFPSRYARETFALIGLIGNEEIATELIDGW